MKKALIVVVAVFVLASWSLAYAEEYLPAAPTYTPVVTGNVDRSAALERQVNKIQKRLNSIDDTNKVVQHKLNSIDAIQGQLQQQSAEMAGLAGKVNQNTAATLAMGQKMDSFIDGVSKGMSKMRWEIFGAVLVFLGVAIMIWRSLRRGMGTVLNTVNNQGATLVDIRNTMNAMPGAVKVEMNRLEPITLPFTIGKRQFTYTPQIITVGGKQMYESIYVPKEVKGDQTPEAIVQMPMESTGKLFKSTLSVLANWVDHQFDDKNDEYACKQMLVINCAIRMKTLREVK